MAPYGGVVQGFLDQSFRGVLLGTAVGDAVGLPREGLSRRRAMRLLGGAPLHHRFVLGHGMLSDDTEHACMTAQALLAASGDTEKFAAALAWRLRWWLVGLPAGVGMATARSIVKLWLGFPPARSGVWSAGNGPAMRAAIIGVYCASNLGQLRALVHVSSRMTHSDPAAEQGALAIALAAAYAVGRGANPVEPDEYLAFVRPFLVGTETLTLIEEVAVGVKLSMPFSEYLKQRGLDQGISGFINHTVPTCLFSWLSSPTDFRAAVEQVVLAGGDTDSTGAIVGALAGITAGPEGIPLEWTDRLREWPRTVGWMNRLADTLAASLEPTRKSLRPIPICWPCLIARNVVFLAIVILHGLRRLLPPY